MTVTTFVPEAPDDRDKTLTADVGEPLTDTELAILRRSAGARQVRRRQTGALRSLAIPARKVPILASSYGTTPRVANA